MSERRRERTQTMTSTKNATATTLDIRPMCGAIKVNGKRCKLFVTPAKYDHNHLHIPTRSDSIMLSADDYGSTVLRDAFDNVKNETDVYTDYFDNDSVVVSPGDRNYDVAFAIYVKTLQHNAKVNIRRCESRRGTKWFDEKRLSEWSEFLKNLNTINIK